MYFKDLVYIFGGVLLLICLMLAIFSTIILVKVMNLNKTVRRMQDNNNNNSNNNTERDEFHIKRPRAMKPTESEFGFGRMDMIQGEEPQRRGFSQNQPPRVHNPMKSEDHYGAQPNQSSLLGVPGKKEPPKVQPKNVHAYDNYLNPAAGEDPFRKSSQMTHMSDDVFMKNTPMENDNFRSGPRMDDGFGRPSPYEGNPSRTRANNMDNNNFFY